MQDKIDGLLYVVTKIEEPPLEKYIAKNYDLYELYFENQSNKTFSIPAYSIDLGVDYSTFNEVRTLYKDKSKKRAAVFNIAAGAASIAFGGIARTAANTAFRSVDSLKLRGSSFDDDSNLLSPNKTYVLYPGDSRSLFLLVSKYLYQVPNTIKFICHDEDVNLNYIIINNNLEVKNVSATNTTADVQNTIDEKTNIEKSNVISAPTTEQYK